MKITWAGQSCFQISVSHGKDHSADIVVDPFSGVGLKEPNFSADLLLVTHSQKNQDYKELVKGDPFLIETPGEYEVGGVFVQGIESFSDNATDKNQTGNTIYVLETEDMRLCHLGNFSEKQLSDEQLEKIGQIDILMIPVGGTDTIASPEAQKIISQIEPKIVIPMHYALPKLTASLDSVDVFLKTMGKKETPAQDKLVIKQSALPKDGDMEIIVLNP